MYHNDNPKMLIAGLIVITLALTLYSCSINEAKAYYNKFLIQCEENIGKLISKDDMAIMKFDNDDIVIYRNMVRDGYSILAKEENSGEYCRIAFADVGSINVPYYFRILSEIGQEVK